MITAIFALVAASFVVLGGNAARLAASIAMEPGARLPLLVTATLSQSAIAVLMALAGASLVPAMGHEMARVLAAGALAVGAFFALRPYPLHAPSEPTRSFGAVALVLAAYSIRDGLAPLALALGLMTVDMPGLLVGLIVAIVAGNSLALREGVPVLGANARYLAAILMAGAAFYIGAFAA